jgi:methylated-DNA-protein-cysteine methyltransferase related protein
MALDFDFFSQVYAVVRQIPYGRVSSYGAIGTFLGARRSARMVGYAMNAAHAQPDIPAHRVLNRNGLLTGRLHFETPTRMQELLEAEGIRVVEYQVQDFSTVFWSPELLLERQY